MAASVSVSVQAEAFDAGAELGALGGGGEGGIASFVGVVRGSGGIVALEIEHHPRMTLAAVARVAEDAARRWPLTALRVVHRYGMLQPGEAIVFIGAASPHRPDAFAAVEFAIDRLKTGAPFWKREHFDDGRGEWVAARTSDDSRADRWG